MADPSFTYKLTNRNALVTTRVTIGGGYSGVATAVVTDQGDEVEPVLDEDPLPAQAPVGTSASCIDRDLFVIGTADQPPTAPANPPRPILSVTLWETAGGVDVNVRELTRSGDRPTSAASSTIDMLISFLPPGTP